MINLESKSEEDKSLSRIGTIDDGPCRCLIDKGASHVLLGTDHPFVKGWITRRSLPDLSNAPVPLAAITRAQNQALEKEDAANTLASAQSGAKVKSFRLNILRLSQNV